MRNKKIMRFSFLLIFVFLLVVGSVTILAQKKAKQPDLTGKMTFTGTVVMTNGQTPSFTMEIKRVTSDEELRSSLSILKSKGQDGFQKAIEKQDLGYFALDGRIGQTLKFVTETETESGTKIVAVFERWLQPFELRYGTRSADYPFTYIELFYDNDGKGSGMAIGAARIKVDKKTPNLIEFENFGAFPLQLIGVQMSRIKL
jgi:hypothetical protein